MKIFSGAVLAISCIPSSVAFVANSQRSVKTQLNLKAENENNGGWNHAVGPALAGLAGLTLASQMAVAAPLDPSVAEIGSTPIVVQGEMSMTKIETSPMSAISGSSIQLADDYLDFSMPSYGDTVSNSAKAKASESAPAFSNPFGDFDFGSSSDTSDEDKAAAKAAKEQAAAEKAAAREQAAADKKAADEAAAAQKKAEKEARREAEKEKQRLAVQRANELKEEKEKAAADAAATASYELPEFKAPEVKVPEFKAPDVKVPDFKAPDIKVPDFKAPDFSGFKAPETTSVDIPEFKAPDIKLPEVSMPKFSMPKAPEMPKIDTSSISTPSFSAPSTSFEAPKIPKFDAPSVPSFSTPSFSSSASSSGGYASLDEDIVDDQEERDAAAKEARSAFNEADANAKEVENKARQLRAIADDKKKIAKEAKDAACATRFGGKILCIRPFGIGY